MSSEFESLDATRVSVYPAKEYYSGDLPNVSREKVGPDDSSTGVGYSHDFTDLA